MTLKREELLAQILDFNPDNEMDDREVARRYFADGWTTRCEVRDVRWARNRLRDGTITRGAVERKRALEGKGVESVRAWNSRPKPRSTRTSRKGSRTLEQVVEQPADPAAHANDADTFAHRMEQWALQLNALMCRVDPSKAHLYADGRNMQPWYSAPCLFESPADRVFLAVNPGGAPSREYEPYSATAHDCDESGCRHGRFNAWLDQSWGGEPAGMRRNQVAVLKAFQALYGEREGETTLRDTPCFEVCPLRTSKAKDLPEIVWRHSIEWCGAVLEQLRPKAIICNGNSEGRSPWAAVCSMYEVKTRGRKHLLAKGSLKWGRIAKGSLVGCSVIGVPHLSYVNQFGGSRVYDALRDLSGQLKLAQLPRSVDLE